jgi:DNA-directed RNA polymerase sigma subunit (sigma70/sigma32)
MATEQSRARRALTADPGLSGLDRSTRTMIGLELLAMRAKPGVTLTRDDIAAWCGCTQEAIRRIEVQALRRLRKARAFLNVSMRSELLAK